MGWYPQLVLVSVLSVTVVPSSIKICDYSQCNCSGTKWINASCVFNSTQKQLDITPDTLPRNLTELQISGPRDVVLYNGSFSHTPGLNLVRLSDVDSLTIGKKAFARPDNQHLLLEVTGAKRVILESNAFYELLKASVSAKFSRIEHLIVQGATFDRLQELKILQVSQLDLHAKAFYWEPKRGTEEILGPATKITLDRVKVKELTNNVFPSLNQLTIINSEVGVVRSSSFHAMHFSAVNIVNTTIKRVEPEAFTMRSFINKLVIEGSTLGLLESNCVQAGINNLVVQGSSLSTVGENAFNTSVATVSLSENMFDHVHRQGLTFKDTTMLTVENNRFNILDDNAFNLPYGEATGQMINVTTFRGNSLGVKIGKGILDFNRSNQRGVDVFNNSFDYQCQCEGNTKSWLKEMLNGLETLVNTFYESSFCQVNIHLSRCFNISRGAFMMENFTLLACKTEDQYHCSEVIQSDAAVPAVTDVFSDETSADRERKVLGSILIFVVSGILLMLVFSGFMWLRRNGYCTKARLLLLPSTDSLLNIITGMFVGSTSTSGTSSSGNRATAHEYATLAQAQKQAEDSAEEDISLEDKATQTLPEELTQELLQSLREKLDDPDNYGEARDMIEHFYDLIKVEESCNQNSDFTSLQLEDLDDLQEGENIYDIIQPKSKTRIRVPQEKKSLVSVGTRAPSPDKLLPLSLSRRKPAIVSDYMEPRDQQLHVYQELPATPSILCDYMEPPDSKPHVYLELSTPMANRPLPVKPDLRLSDPGEGPSSG